MHSLLRAYVQKSVACGEVLQKQCIVYTYLDTTNISMSILAMHRYTLPIRLSISLFPVLFLTFYGVSSEPPSILIL